MVIAVRELLWQETSGEKIGSVSTPAPVVRRMADPPSRPALHRSFAT